MVNCEVRITANGEDFYIPVVYLSGSPPIDFSVSISLFFNIDGYNVARLASRKLLEIFDSIVEAIKIDENAAISIVLSGDKEDHFVWNITDISHDTVIDKGELKNFLVLFSKEGI